MMSPGKGATTSSSSKHKIQGKTSMENKIIAVHDTPPQVLWTRNFINAQGYQVDQNKIRQDNISAQLLEKNGRFSSSNKTKHIKHRYFFIKDKVDQGDIDTLHSLADAPFPEDCMWADLPTKPKSGSLFYYEDRSVLMNCPVNYMDST